MEAATGGDFERLRIPLNPGVRRVMEWSSKEDTMKVETALRGGPNFTDWLK